MFGNRCKVVAGKVAEGRGGSKELSDELVDGILIGRKGSRKGGADIFWVFLLDEIHCYMRFYKNDGFQEALDYEMPHMISESRFSLGEPKKAA